MRYAIGVDLGGTNIRAALVDENGEIIGTDMNDNSSLIEEQGEDGSKVLEKEKSHFVNM